jgi:hypothetical protein
MKKLSLTFLLLFCLFASNAQNYWSATPLYTFPYPYSIRFSNNGEIYLSNNADFYHFDGNSINKLISQNNLSSHHPDFRFDSNGILWFNNRYIFSGYNLLNDSIKGASNPYSNDEPKSLCIDKSGNVWVSQFYDCFPNFCDSSRILMLNKDSLYKVTLEYTVYTPNLGNFYTGFGQIEADNNGDLYGIGMLNTNINQLLKFEPNNGTLQEINIEPNYEIEYKTIAPNGDLFAVYYSLTNPNCQKLKKFSNGIWTTINLPASFCSLEKISGIVCDQQSNLHILSNYNLYKYNNINFTSITIPYGRSISNSYFYSFQLFEDQVSFLNSNRDTLFNFNLNGINKISGKIFIDSNADSTYQSNERLVEPWLVDCSGILILSDKYGFNYYPDTIGNTIIQISPPNYWKLNSPNPINVNQTQLGEFTDSINFAITPLSTVLDIGISATSHRIRSGQLSSFTATVFNYGTVNANGSVAIQLDTSVTFNSAINASVINNGQNITWSFGTLKPLERKSITILVMVDSTIAFNAPLNHNMTAYPVTGDIDTANNYLTTNWINNNSYDPNDKQVSPIGVGPNNDILTQELSYTIRFQNTGNDTAYTVVIIDTLDTDLDLSTLKIEGSSHNFKTRLDGQVLRFTFNNILLPDSNVNEPLSHGFISFKITPKTGLPANTSINNRAAIYFDYNDPVITNTTLNTIQYTVSIEEIENSDNVVILYPNPLGKHQVLNFNKQFDKNTTYVISDISGRIISNKTLINNSISSDNLPTQSGMYLLKIITPQGNIYSSKLLIE